MKKRVWIHVGDIVLLGMREDFSEDGKADVMLKYFDYEARDLQEEYGELPTHWKINEGEQFYSDEGDDSDAGFGSDSDEETKGDKKPEIDVNKI